MRTRIAATWRHQGDVRLATALAGVLWLVAATNVLVGGRELALGAGLAALLGTIALGLWIVAIFRTGWRLTRSWERTTELGDVRAHRPQAGSEDPDVVHDEFAVTVEDGGQLVTWRFRPLLISERPGEDEIEVPGRPCYAGSPVDEVPFDAHNTVHAAEQLVIAQAKAADREATAARAARAEIEAGSVLAEARTTAAALRRATGQRSRRD